MSVQGGVRETTLGRGAEVGAGPTGVTNIGGGDVGARLTVAEGGYSASGEQRRSQQRVPRQRRGGRKSYLPKH